MAQPTQADFQHALGQLANYDATNTAAAYTRGIQGHLTTVSRYLAANQAQGVQGPPGPAGNVVAGAGGAAGIATVRAHRTPPEPFSGDRELARPFIDSLQVYMGQFPVDFPDDESRVRYAVLLLKGTALQWARPIIADLASAVPNPPTWAEFRRQFEQAFFNPTENRSALQKLQSLTQGNDDVAAYAAKWRNLVSLTGWTEDGPLQASFAHGLQGRILDRLADHDDPRDVEELITRAIRIDNRQTQRWQEKKNNPPPSTPQQPRRALMPGGQPQNRTTTGASQNSQQQFRTPQYPPLIRMQSTPPPQQPRIKQEPVNVVRGKLSIQERMRRIANHLCLYCGLTGHIAAQCPNNPHVGVIEEEPQQVNLVEEPQYQTNNLFVQHFQMGTQ